MSCFPGWNISLLRTTTCRSGSNLPTCKLSDVLAGPYVLAVQLSGIMDELLLLAHTSCIRYSTARGFSYQLSCAWLAPNLGGTGEPGAEPGGALVPALVLALILQLCPVKLQWYTVQLCWFQSKAVRRRVPSALVFSEAVLLLQDLSNFRFDYQIFGS